MIFLSYVSEDRARVMPFYELLDAHNLAPWMDCMCILSGQNWDYEITTALERSDIIIVFVSENSVDKRGYAQKEISFAIDRIKEKLVGDIYVIPIQLDPVDFPSPLKGIQFLQTEHKSSTVVEQELLDAIQAALKKSNDKVSEAQTKAEVRWHLEASTSAYNGIPGYSTSIQRIAISSSKYTNVRDIADHINGTLATHSMSSRSSALEPEPSSYNLMQDEWQRTHTFDAIFTSAQVVGRVFSVEYSLHWYSAGAAHPIHSPKSFCYLLDPIVHLSTFSELFLDDSALVAIQSEVRDLLNATLCREENELSDRNWIYEGTKEWSDFSNFAFSDDGLLISFASYQVACFAAGTPTVKVPYESISRHLVDNVLHALGLHRPRS
nr:TIR domain-containing protein [Sulfitobacter mediterraneus]